MLPGGRCYRGGHCDTAQNPSALPPAMPVERTNARFVFAGIPAVVAAKFPGVDAEDESKPICLGQLFPTKSAFLAQLEVIWREGGPEISTAVWPFALSVTTLLDEGMTLYQMYVGRRKGRYYFSDKNDMWKDLPVFSGKVHERIQDGDGTVSDLGRLVEEVCTILGIDSGILPAKTPAFLRAHLGRTVEIAFTAGDTHEERTWMCAEYNNLMNDDVGSTPSISFKPVLPQQEAFRIALPIILANNMEEYAFGCVGNGHTPSEMVGVFIGCSTCHVCQWTDRHIPSILQQRRMSAGASYTAHRTPVPPTSFVSTLNLDETNDYTRALRDSTWARD